MVSQELNSTNYHKIWAYRTKGTHVHEVESSGTIHLVFLKRNKTLQVHLYIQQLQRVRRSLVEKCSAHVIHDNAQ